jgi:hypothetical protein
MNFKEWFNKYNNNQEQDLNKEQVFLCSDGWDACREEVLKIIFLNTKLNGKKTVNIDTIIQEIESL